MKLTISEGNNKLGRVPNISFPPGFGCAAGVPCYSQGCYAKKAYFMYPGVIKAWRGNMDLWWADPAEFELRLKVYLVKHNPRVFRYHVGGDIPDQHYLEMMYLVAATFYGTKFLCFTKRYDLKFFPERANNLSIVLSAWPGLEFENPLGLPVAYLSEDHRAPLGDTHIKCVGHCGDCGQKCWGTKLDIIFDKH